MQDSACMKKKKMHRQVDEWISIGYLRRRSLSGSDWHIQREVLAESLEVFSGSVDCTVEALLVFRTEYIRGNRRVPGCCSSTSYGQALGGQHSPAGSPHSPVWARRNRGWLLLETVDHGADAEVLLPSWACSIRMLSHPVPAGDAPSARGCEEGSCVRCICVSTPRGVLECCLWRPIWRAESHQDEQRSSERHNALSLPRMWMDRCIPNPRTCDRSDGLYLLCQCAMSVCAETTQRGTKTPASVECRRSCSRW